MKRPEETGAVFIRETEPGGEIYEEKVYPQWDITPGKEGCIRVLIRLWTSLYPFYSVPEGLGDPLVILKEFQSQKTAENTFPLSRPENRNLWNFMKQKPSFLK